MADNLEIINDLVKKSLAKGASAADAVCFSGADISVSVRSGQTEEIERSESKGLGLRVIIGKKQAIISSNDYKENQLDQLAQRAIDMAKSSPDDEHLALADKNMFPEEIKDLQLYDGSEPDSDKLLELATKTEGFALDQKGITNTEGASAGYASNNIAIATSNGFLGSYNSSTSSLSVSVLAGTGTKMERDYEYSVARFAQDLDSAEYIGRRAAENTMRRLNPQIPMTGQFPVIYDKRVSKNIAGYLSSAINGISIARKTSFLKDSLGKQIFPENITIINDPFIKKGLGSKPFDAEGVLGRKESIIENGVLKDWLLDIRSANQLGLKTNGNASRGLASSPSPSSSNFYMQNGNVSKEELMSDIKNGVYITETFGMGVNMITGDYSQGAVGFMIENGEITYPVSEFTVAGNLNDMFLNLVAANDLEMKYSTNCPTIKIDKMTIAGG